MAGTVIVLGGGVAGMTVAHELVERGFDVHIFEQRNMPGGKARSINIPTFAVRQNVGSVYLGPLAPDRRDLPGEHGFRFFPRFYKHVIDTMQRIPVGGSRSAADNLVDTASTMLARFDRRPLKLPTTAPQSILELFHQVNDLNSIFGPELGIPPEDFAFFGQRIWQILTSCAERRLGEYEKIGWWEFIGANNRSEEYQKLFGIGCTRSVVAAQARRASSKTIGDMFVQYFFNIAEPTVNADRVLNGPTNDVWLGPWLDYLRSRGVEYHLDSRVRSIELRGGLVRGVTVERDRTVVQEHADYYVAALPVEVMATLITDEMVRVDPSLANIFPLSRNVGWMNGIQFYLSDDVPISRGHTIYLDSPWALTSISQRQFWPGVDLRRYGDGRIRGILSVDISDWDTPGLFGKPARQCTREEVKNEVWEQLKRSLNVTGTTLLSDDNLRDWFLDPDVNPILGTNSEPLLVNLVDTWRLRPTATTRIRNFFLASDYVQTFTDLATMEGANEAGRRAVNGILEACGVTASPCQIWNLHEPELLQAWRAHDLNRYRRGLPWEDTLMSLAMNALAAVQRGALALESSIRNGVGSAAHVEDLLSYLRTGESRSALLERLTSGRDEQAGGDLLRAFAALSRAGTPQSDALSTAAVDALASLSREVSGVRFVES